MEHRLQIMFDLQTHLLPESEDGMRRLAIRMGYWISPAAGLAEFRAELNTTTELNPKF